MSFVRGKGLFIILSKNMIGWYRKRLVPVSQYPVFSFSFTVAVKEEKKNTGCKRVHVSTYYQGILPWASMWRKGAENGLVRIHPIHHGI